MSAEIIPFVPRPRGHRADETPVPSRAPVQPDDLVMGHADTAPCEYLPWHDAYHADHDPA